MVEALGASAMGCGLSRPWRRRPREASVQSIRPLPESSDGEEEETPLLLAVREELCDTAADGPEIHGGSAICPAGSMAFAVKVCGLLGLALAIAAAVVLREPLGKEFHVLHAKMVDLGNLRRFAPGPCFTDQMRKIMEWAILHRAQLLLCGMLLLALFLLKKCSESVAEFVVRKIAGEEHVERFFAKGEVAQMVLLWLADMLSDVYVTYKYCKQRMYVFALLMILIWLGSGCVAFGHRYVSWKLCAFRSNEKYWHSGLNKHGEPKPGFKSFVLYLAQVQPVIMAWEGWLHGMTRRLREEKMLAALAEGAPSSLLQLYAMMLEPPQENSLDLLILCGSIAMSILTVAVGINNAYELCVPESRKLENNMLPPGALLCFRWCDSFSRIGAWALLGMCLRPIGAKLHGVQQPYLPLILAAELLLITAVVKSRSFGLNLACSELFKKEYLVSVMASFLGTYWCCNTADLAAQHRLFKSLLALHIMQTLGILWLCAWSFSIAVGSDCLAVEEPAVVIVALLVLFTFAVTFLTALAHDVALSLFALPFFPVIAGDRGGRLELAARFGVALQIPRLLRAAEEDDDGVAALCQAAEAGQSSVIHALVDAGVSTTAKWRGQSALHWAACGGQLSTIQALQSCGESDLERATDNGGTAAMLAARNGHLEMVQFLYTAGCDLDKANNNGSTAGIWAAQNGHLEVVQFLHRAGCDLDKANNNGSTVGIWAAQNGHLEVVQFLHRAGCDFDKANNSGWTAGMLAAWNGHLEVVQFLHRAGCDFDKAGNDGNTAGMFAAGHGHSEVVQFLHRAGCDLDKASNNGSTAGIWAAQNGHLEVVQFLHRAGCDFDNANNNGFTAGIFAARNGHLEMVQFLHTAGCDLDKANNNGSTAGIWAAQNGHLEVVQFLHTAGCDFDKANNDGCTAGILAALNGHVEVVQFLHTAGCDFDKANNDGCTAGILAALNGHVEVVQFLHRAGCDFDKADNDGCTAGILAALNGHVEVVQFLHRAGCDFDKADNNGDTAGILAALNGHVEVVQFLHRAGCDFDKANNDGWTAGMYAAENGHVEVVKYLRSAGYDSGVRSLHAAADGDHLMVVEFLLGFVDVNAAGIGRTRALDIARAKDPNGPVTEALLRAGASPGPEPQLVGLTALKPPETPPHGYIWFTCGAPNLAQSRGKFYHEIQILSEFDCPQLGWLSTDFKGGDDDDDVGVGDEANGWAFDGQRCGWWHGGRREPLQIAPWKVNDVLGLAIDLDEGQMQLRTGQQELTMPFKAHGAVCLDPAL